jgi:hypothetical protein
MSDQVDDREGRLDPPRWTVARDAPSGQSSRRTITSK